MEDNHWQENITLGNIKVAEDSRQEAIAMTQTSLNHGRCVGVRCCQAKRRTRGGATLILATLATLGILDVFDACTPLWKEHTRAELG